MSLCLLTETFLNGRSQADSEVDAEVLRSAAHLAAADGALAVVDGEVSAEDGEVRGAAQT